MNWAIPRAPAGETALGLKPDSAISCAASSPGETFQREAERRIGSRYGAGTKLGQPGAPSEAVRLAARARGGDRVAGLRAGRRAGDVAEMPGLPRIPPQEAEPRGVREQPAVGARGARGRARSRSDEASGPAARPSADRDAARRARPARRPSGSPRRPPGRSRRAARPPPSGRRRPPRPAASPRRPGRRAARSSRRPRPAPASRSRRRPAPRPRRPPRRPPGSVGAPRAARHPAAAPDRSRATLARARSGGLELASGKAMREPGRVDPVPPRGVDGGQPGPRQVLGPGEVARFGAPSGSLAGASSRGTSSRMLRAAESAARSAARWTRPLPVAAPPIAARASAARIRISPAPSSAGSACPRLPPAGRVNRRAPAAAARSEPRAPRPSRPARPRRARGARRAARGARRDPAAQPPPRKLLDRERRQRALGRERDEQAAARGRSPSTSSAGTQSRPGRCTTASSAPGLGDRAASAPTASASSSARWQRWPRAAARRPGCRSASSSSRAPGAASSVGPAPRARPTSTSRVPAPVRAAASAATAAASPRLAPRSAPRDEDRRRSSAPSGATATRPPS